MFKFKKEVKCGIEKPQNNQNKFDIPVLVKMTYYHRQHGASSMTVEEAYVKAHTDGFFYEKDGKRYYNCCIQQEPYFYSIKTEPGFEVKFIESSALVFLTEDVSKR